MDAVESTLGGLAAVEIAATTYVLEKLDKLGGNVTLWTVGSLAVMLVAITLALIGVFAFEGEDAPNLVEFDVSRRKNREEALVDTVETILEAYRFNRVQLQRKQALRTFSVGITGLVVAVYFVHVLGLV
ncbi:MAG: hypothetical protein NVSMB64_24410 [Candidatus Velthaea sp.]